MGWGGGKAGATLWFVQILKAQQSSYLPHNPWQIAQLQVFPLEHINEKCDYSYGNHNEAYGHRQLQNAMLHGLMVSIEILNFELSDDTSNETEIWIGKIGLWTFKEKMNIGNLERNGSQKENKRGKVKRECINIWRLGWQSQNAINKLQGFPVPTKRALVLDPPLGRAPVTVYSGTACVLKQNLLRCHWSEKY